MKYPCICHYDNYEDITKQEMKHMLRGRRHRVSLSDFIDYYDIPKENVINFAWRKGINLLHNERIELRNMGEEKDRGKEGEWCSVSGVPKGLICAMYNVPYEVVNGKRAYDMEFYNRAVYELQNKVDDYFNSDIVEESDIKPIDLIAMRYYRKVSREEMAKKLHVTKKMIKEIESNSGVSKRDATEYMRVLSVSQGQVRQLRKVMSGKLKKVNESRVIPPLVRLSVYLRDKGKCCRCEEKDRLHYHHIKRYADGGPNTKENLMLLCVSCHAEEHKGEQVYHMLKSSVDK